MTRMFTLSEKKWLWISFFCCVGVLYVLNRHAYFVGFFNDDAFFIIGAQSLLHGSFREINQPGAPPLVNYMPGYPLLLLPFGFLFRNPIPAYQLLSIAFTIGNLVLIRLLYRDQLSTQVLLSTMLIAAFNPLAVSLSGTVLSDVPYLTVSLLLVLLIQRVWDEESWQLWVGAACLAGFAYYIRPVGLAWSLSIFLLLVLEKRWRPAALIFCVTIILMAPFSIRTYLVRGQLLHYASELTSPYRNGMSWSSAAMWFFQQARYYAHELFVRNLFRWPPVLQTNVVDVVTIGICLGLTLAGFLSTKKKGWEKVLFIYLVIYSCIHLAWSKQSGRYLLPIFPFVAVSFFQGAEKIGKRVSQLQYTPCILAALILLLYIKPLEAIVRASLFLQTPVNTPALHMYEWVRSRTGPGDIFAAELDGQFFLYTGRSVVHLPKIFDDATFNQWLHKKNVAYVLIDANPFLMKTHQGSLEHDPYPSVLLVELLRRLGFEPVFRDDREGMTIFHVASKYDCALDSLCETT